MPPPLSMTTKGCVRLGVPVLWESRSREGTR